MKALKEKRIGLRSLWRRGLVILSLFALVFASCSDSGGDDGGGTATPPNKTPLEIRVVTQPTATSYEGKAVDITGMVIEVRYASDPDTWVTVRDPLAAGYGVNPKYTQFRSGTGTSGAVSNTYYIFTMGDGQPIYQVFTPNVSNLIRKDTTGMDRPNFTSPVFGADSSDDTNDFWAQGVQLTVDIGSYRTKYRVDEYPDFANMKLQGDYEDGTRQEIPLSRDMRWEIRPLYNNGNDTGKGLLIVSVGGTVGQSLWGVNSSSGYAPSLDMAKGVQVGVPLDEVYHVTGIKLANPEAVREAIGSFYYWDRDDPAFWLSNDGRSGRAKDAQLEISYSDGSTRTITVEEAVRQNTVWYNLNPAANERPLTVAGIHETVTKLDLLKTFWPNHRNPRIAFYYRGHYDYLNVPIYTRFTGISVSIRDGGDNVAMSMRHQDNDYIGKNADDFAKAIKVVATFTAFSDSSLPAAELELTYQGIRPYYTVKPDISSDGTAPVVGTTMAAVPVGDAYDTMARAVVAFGKPFRNLSSDVTGNVGATGNGITGYFGGLLASPQGGARTAGSGGVINSINFTDWRKTYYNGQYASAQAMQQVATASPGLEPYNPRETNGSLYPRPGTSSPATQGVTSGVGMAYVNDTGTLVPITSSTLAMPLPGGQKRYVDQYDMTYDGGPYVYTMNFGDPDYTWDRKTRSWKLGNYAWGESANPANNGRTRNVTIYYTPGLGGVPAETNEVGGTNDDLPWVSTSASPGPSARSQRVPVAWSNIPTLYADDTRNATN